MPKFIDVGVVVTIRREVPSTFDLHAPEGSSLYKTVTKQVERALGRDFNNVDGLFAGTVTRVEFIGADTEAI
tara:strand:+ start:3378 stop:3593 length:216 start_codon:yes stop_codon:yes gene_type:complete